MASSKKLLKNNSVRVKNAAVPTVNQHAPAAQHPLVVHLQAFLTNAFNLTENLKQPQLLLALSGGLDSCVLLHLLSALNKSGTLPFESHALHVHHGLSANADDWFDFCVAQCAKLNVPLQIVQVKVDKNSGLGIEAAARQLRYQALFNYRFEANGEVADYIVTAHHQDDQAETLLLQLFRGSGVKGLAAMAAVDKPRRLLRPLLDVSRQTLHDYAMQHNIDWCEDESNIDTKYERNFVRHDVLSMLETRAPAVKSVLARTASHLAEASDLLDSLAEMDAKPLIIETGHENSLCLQGLSALDIPRTKNVLRWWFSKNHLAMPNTEQLNEIVDQLLNAKPDANVCLELSSFSASHLTLRRYQQRAYLCREQTTQPFDMVWNGEASLSLPNGGQLEFKQVIGEGLAVKFGMTKLRVTNRDGGERFKPNVLRPTRTLKHLLQEANMPPWQREHLPLIYWQDTLACVPGIGIAHELQATEGEQGIMVYWQDSPKEPQ
ncbi:tRNA(Ile)-lysidine synthase [mine drainage metagenome]|uniref:tRNA(Ile)-lysidine synthetase n=1 Tax=mine drainage metagenome TaxID=410659 RepID=A0A1J5TN66_9ZZZZ